MMGQGDSIKATSYRWHGGHPDELPLYLHALIYIYNTSISAILVE